VKEEENKLRARGMLVYLLLIDEELFECGVLEFDSCCIY